MVRTGFQLNFKSKAYILLRTLKLTHVLVNRSQVTVDPCNVTMVWPEFFEVYFQSAILILLCLLQVT